jgi:hypothetical protein
VKLSEYIMGVEKQVEKQHARGYNFNGGVCNGGVGKIAAPMKGGERRRIER